MKNLSGQKEESDEFCVGFDAGDDSDDTLESSLSLRDLYGDLLNRNDLILPPKYMIVLKKQNYLDLYLSYNYNNILNYKIQSSNKKEFKHAYKDIKTYFKSSHGLKFDNDDFEKILFVGPFYYIYQGIMMINKNKIELKYIDIPKDFDRRIKSHYDINTNFTLLQTPKNYEPLRTKMNKFNIEKRRILFRNILINMTVEQHNKFLKENNYPFFDPIKCKTWHHLFDLKNVSEIGNYALIENVG